MNNMDDSFDFNDYRDVADISTQKEPKKKAAKADVDLGSDEKFSFDDYREPEEVKDTHPYGLQYAQYTPEEYEALSPEKKKELQEYNPLKGAFKGVLKGTSAGFNEKNPGMFGLAGVGLNEVMPFKVEEHEVGSGVGEFFGEIAPIAKLHQALSIPLKAIPTAYKWATRAGKTAAAIGTGAGLETAKEVAKGEGLDAGNIATQGAIFGLFDTAARAIPAIKNWVKSLNTSQRAEMLVDGAIPKDLPPTSYKFYETEVVPELQKVAEAEYQSAYQASVEKNNIAFEQKMRNVQAEHEKELYELAKKKQLSQEIVEKSKLEYENKMKQVAAEHQAELEQMEKANQQAMQEFEESKIEFERTKSRQAVVENAIKNIPEESGVDLKGRVSGKGKDQGVRPQAPSTPARELEDKVGSVIAPQRIKNTYDAGQKNVKGVKATDEADYRVVKELYNDSEKLNDKVVSEHSNLANDLRAEIADLKSIPDPSPPQKQAISSAEKVLDELLLFDDKGNAIGFKPTSNKVLLDQAKALRYYLDYDFSHGDSANVLKPLINALQDAAETAAISTGNEAAVTANKAARAKWREWSDLYQNDFIRKYRDSGNHKFSQTFENSLNVDDFLQLDKVLSRTNEGQQLAAQTRRALIEKKLNPFFENPRTMNRKEFNKTLSELDPVLNPGEELAIRQSFNEARKTPVIQGKKLPGINSPKEPKSKSIDQVNIPKYNPPKINVEEPTSVKIPLKPEVKSDPAMRAASKKMKITPEEVMKLTNTPTGMKQLKRDLMKAEHGERLFNEIGQRKVKEILFQGNVQRKFTGGELYDIINKGDNFDMLSEILGKEAATDMLESAAAIGAKKLTRDSLKKYAKKLGTVKAALVFGII